MRHITLFNAISTVVLQKIEYVAENMTVSLVLSVNVQRVSIVPTTSLTYKLAQIECTAELVRVHGVLRSNRTPTIMLICIRIGGYFCTILPRIPNEKKIK